MAPGSASPDIAWLIVKHLYEQACERPASAREAFILFALEGFTPDEIAAITDRKVDDVRASVGVAREHLRKSAMFATPSRQKPIARSNTA